MVGGVILEDGNKKTSHAWTEVFIENQWIPFDVLNDHFASLPAHYMQLYTSDLYLIKHTTDINFDYVFDISSSYIAALHNPHNQYASPILKAFSLWNIVESGLISKPLLQSLLLIPIAALIIVLLKNIIGIKTFGGLFASFTGLIIYTYRFDIW